MNINKNKHFTLQVAIPSSSLVNDKTLRDKTLKISKFARAFSIFGVSKVFIYKDDTITKEYKKYNKTYKKSYKFYRDDEILLLKLILEYLDTPQYLRKSLYPISTELRYAGLLEPINAPHHKKKIRLDEIKEGDLRVGIVTNIEERQTNFPKKNLIKYMERTNNLIAKEPKNFYLNNQNNSNKMKLPINRNYISDTRHVDVGLDYIIPFIGNTGIGQKVIVKFVGKYPNIMAVEASDHDLEKEYWGYQVFISSSLCDFLTMQVKKKLILLTSRNGKNLKENESSFKDLLISYNNNLLIVYGSPNKDLNEICKHLTDVIGNRSAMYVNLFSEQQTGSIRLEEAILGSLSIVNYILK